MPPADLKIISVYRWRHENQEGWKVDFQGKILADDVPIAENLAMDCVRRNYYWTQIPDSFRCKTNCAGGYVLLAAEQ